MEVDDPDIPANVFVADIPQQEEIDSLLEDMQMMHLNNPQEAMLLDAPQKPKINMNAQQDTNIVEQEPPTPRKKRSIYTLCHPFRIQDETNTLTDICLRAIELAKPENPAEYFVDFLLENLNSKNFPNGVGLPQRWGT